MMKKFFNWIYWSLKCRKFLSWNTSLVSNEELSEDERSFPEKLWITGNVAFTDENWVTPKPDKTEIL
jgi:hypothetical protein